MTHTPPSSINSYLLKDMVEVAIPESISWWPQTLGWQLIALALIAWLIFYSYKKLMQYRNNRYRREALHALSQISGEDTAQQARHLFLILKACLNHLDTRNAKLSGSAFLTALDTYASQEQAQFASELGQRWQHDLLVPAGQTQLQPADINQLTEMAKSWVASHQVPTQNAETAAHNEGNHV